MCNENFMKLSEYRNSFEKLQTIFYKDIHINGLCIRILGINYMDFVLDWIVKKHKHSFFETHYITKNNTFTTVNGQEFEINPGQFYVIPPGSFHSHRQKEGTGHIGFSLRWEVIKEMKRDGDFGNISCEFDKVYTLLLNAPSVPVSDKDNILFEDIILMFKIADKGGSILELQLAFLQMLVHYSNYFKGISKDVKNEINYAFLENQIVSTAIKFIEENYAQEIDVNEISNSVYLSYSHLSRLFKKYSGESISQYLNGIRLKKAQLILMCIDKSISHIAREVGFNSEFYFCKVFKKFYNISPGVFRKAKGILSD